MKPFFGQQITPLTVHSGRRKAREGNLVCQKPCLLHIFLGFCKLVNLHWLVFVQHVHTFESRASLQLHYNNESAFECWSVALQSNPFVSKPNAKSNNVYLRFHLILLHRRGEDWDLPPTVSPRTTHNWQRGCR